MKKVLQIILAGAAVLSLAACSGNQESGNGAEAETESSQTGESEPSKKESFEETKGIYTVTDVRGKEIEFEERPQRIAATGKPLPSILFAILGENDCLVGCNPSSVTAYEESVLKEMYPQMAQAETEWCGKSGTVNVEELLTLKPDAVLCWDSAAEEIEKMEAAGLKVIALHSSAMDSIVEDIQIISSLYQMEERGQELIDYINQQTEEVTSRLADIPDEEKPAVIEFYDDMNVSVSQYEHWMAPSGCINPASELTGDLTDVDMEQMILWNPDIIYIGNHTSLQPSDLLENKQEGKDWSVLDAVKNRQVYKIPIGAYRWDPAGVETPLMIKWAAKIQYPDVFADMDMKEEVKEFFEYVYQFELTEDMVSDILDHTQE